MLVLTNAQLAQLAEPPRQKQREQLMLEMEAAWQLFSPTWATHFERGLTREERMAFYRQMADWGIEKGLQKQEHYLKLGVMLMRAVYYDFDQEDIDMALGQLEASIDEGKPEDTLDWIDYCLTVAEEA